MEIVDTSTMTPLLLWLFANTAGSDRLTALLALESYVVRRSLCRLTTKNYNRLFLELLRRLGSGEGPAGEVITNYLDEQASDSGMWPTDAEVERSLQHTSAAWPPTCGVGRHPQPKPLSSSTTSNVTCGPNETT